MTRNLKTFAALLGLLGSTVAGWGFTVLGEREDWMRFDIGYHGDGDADPDIGAPKNLGDEYRWYSPVFTWAVDDSFLNYFGAEGEKAVIRAFEILNSVPAASALTNSVLDSFPRDTRRFNHTASELGILDIKSWILSTVLNQIGVGSAERWTFALRDRRDLNGRIIYSVIRRNFDPSTLLPTSFVNGQLYTYRIQQTRANPDQWDAVEVATIPGLPVLSTVASLDNGTGGGGVDGRGSDATFLPGLFYTGLTRDDVAAIRYMLSPSNFNIEYLPTNVVASALGGGGGGVTINTNATVIGGSLGVTGGLPWGLPGTYTVSGTTGTTGGGSSGLTGNPWDLPGTFQVVTDPNAGGGTTGGGTTGGVVDTLNLRQGLRPGVDKITFTRVPFDSVLGQVPTPPVVRYTDRVVVNGRLRTQSVQRVIRVPDLLISAGDLGVNAVGVPTRMIRTTDQFNNISRTISTTNAVPTDPGFQIYGPGLVQEPTGAETPIYIALSKIGPYIINAGGGTEVSGTQGFRWGNFDGTTNAPIVFPVGTSIKDLEDQVLRQ